MTGKDDYIASRPPVPPLGTITRHGDGYVSTCGVLRCGAHFSGTKEFVFRALDRHVWKDHGV